MDEIPRKRYPDRYVITALTAKASPTVNVKKGERIYLYWSPEGGGWWQWQTGGGHRFESKDSDRFKDAMLCAPDVGPWYYAPDPTTIEVQAVPAIVTVS